MDIITHSPSKRLLQSKKILIAMGILCGLIAGGITLLFPLQYRADAQVYILSQARFGVDPYTVAKSGERIAENLAQVMGTEDFYTKVKSDTASQVDWAYFEKYQLREKMKLWKKTIDPTVVFGTSILTISAFHQDPDQAIAIAAGAANTVVGKTSEYVGGDVSIRLVSQPIVTRFPVQPNLLVNVLVGMMAGILLAGFVVVRK